MEPRKIGIKLKNGRTGVIFEDPNFKVFRSPGYNYMFRKEDGLSVRWGVDRNDDGDPRLGLPEIMDIEVSKQCAAGCAFCYKNNVKKGQNMSLETFRSIMDRICGGPRMITITEEDGTITKLPPKQKVILLDGTTKEAKDLVEGDYIVNYIIK